MTALTTRQRDLLTALINTQAPKGTDDLAAELNLSSRQINYALKGINKWLSLRDIQLEIKAGIGIRLNCSEEQTEIIRRDLASIDHLQLILTAEERQQLLALVLLVSDEPKYLLELEKLALVSRTTIVKDLDAIEAWFNHQGMIITRRPNYGIEVSASEDLRQKLITMLLWGKTPFGKPLTKINHTHGLIFELEQDADLHPLVQRSHQILQSWNMGRVFSQIAYAEAQLGGRFTDDAYLHLALVFAIQTDRILKGQHLPIIIEHIQVLNNLPIWDVAKMIARRLGWNLRPAEQNRDIAGIAMWLHAAPRNENLPGDFDKSFDGLIAEIMEMIAGFYNSPEMGVDLVLRDGLRNHIIPAYLREKYNLWQPFPYPNFTLEHKYFREHEVAKNLADLIEERTNFSLPDSEINNIAALLRAARIRQRPHLFRQVLVVCPGGMATAQLLMSRLEARFPRLGPLKVISMRELTDDQIKPADLIISTVPLAESVSEKITVLHVHPLLLADDVEAIMRFIS